MANQPIPIKNTAYTLIVPIFDNDGDLVSGAAGLDSEVSKDGGAFANCTNEAAEIGSTGMYSLALTATEMDADIVTVIVKTSTTDAKTTPVVLYPYGSTAGTEVGVGDGLDDTLGGIRWLLRARLNDLKPDGTAGGNYSTKVLDAWINLSHRETVFRAKCHKDTVSITLIAGQSEYDCEPVFDVTELALSEKRIDRREFLGISVEAWNNDPPGIPEEFTHRTGDKLMVHRTPNAAAAGVVTAIEETPAAGGTGYAVGDVLALVDATGSGATVKVTAVAVGVVTAVRLMTGGEAYTIGEKDVTGGTGNDDCTVEITEVGAARAHGYAYPPALTNDAQIPTAIPRAHRISAILEGAVYLCRDSRRSVYSQAEVNEQLSRWLEIVQKVAEAVRG